MIFSFDIFVGTDKPTKEAVMATAWLVLKDQLGDKFIAHCTRIQVIKLEKGASKDHYVAHVECSKKSTLKALERSFQ